MAVNFFEQLISEWYEFNEYFVRRNILVGKRSKGGYDGELDIVAFHPEKKHLVHIEPSMDADSWAVREKRFQKKFKAGREHIPSLFKGQHLPSEIDQIAVLFFASNSKHSALGDGKLLLVEDVLAEIFCDLKNRKMTANAIPEHLAILRAFQFVVHCKTTVCKIFNEPNCSVTKKLIKEVHPGIAYPNGKP